MRFKSLYKLTFFTFFFSLLLSQNANTKNNQGAESKYGKITAVQSDSLIKANALNPNFVILDVRTPGEWDSGHLPGSINRSTGLTDFTAQLNALPKHKIFLMHCQSGGRSASAFAKMKELGFTEVYEMTGGLNSWNASKLPVTTLVSPKLMFVSKSNIIPGNISDTIKITITNRANGLLTFNSVQVNDLHSVKNNFDHNILIGGAYDYTFSVIHSPAFSVTETTRIELNSNGGNLELVFEFQSGILVGIDKPEIEGLALYPNPASSKFYINGIRENEVDEISVFSITGKQVKTLNNVSLGVGIDVTDIQNGIYLVRIKKGNQVISKEDNSDLFTSNIVRKNLSEKSNEKSMNSSPIRLN